MNPELEAMEQKIKCYLCNKEIGQVFFLVNSPIIAFCVEHQAKNEHQYILIKERLEMEEKKQALEEADNERYGISYHTY